jgi:hypothetical protein
MQQSLKVEMTSDFYQSFRSEIQLFVIGLAISLVAKGVALFPFSRSVDSYPKLVAMSNNVSEAGGAFHEFIAQGRLGQLALIKALSYLGIVGPGGNTLYVFLALCCYVATGILLCRFWHIESRVLQICVVGIFAIHPYHAEIFTFREATLCAGLAVLLGIVGLLVAGRGLFHWTPGWAMMMISMSLYQIAFNYIVIALIVFWILELSRSGESRMPMRFPSCFRNHIPQDVMPRASAIVAALVGYFSVYKLSFLVDAQASSNNEAPRGAMLSLSHFHDRVYDVKHTLLHMFAVPEPLMPKVTKLLIALIAMLAIGVLACKSLRKAGFGGYIELAVICALLSAALLSIMGVLIPLAVWFVPDRTLSGVSVLVAGLFAIVFMNGGIWTRRFAVAIATVLLFSFAGVNNVVLSEQLRVNSRDVETAVRMITRLESNPTFSTANKLAVIGNKHQYPLRFLTARRGSDVSASAFSQPWSKANLLREVSGYDFVVPSRQDLARAEDYCRDSRPWPDPTSVTVLDDIAVICISPTK